MLFRSDYLRADPLRNASHGIRVLVKFKLLEAQALPREACLAWEAARGSRPRLTTRSRCPGLRSYRWQPGASGNLAHRYAEKLRPT